MPFTSYDDLITKLSTGNRFSSPINQVSLATVGVAGTWYSMWQFTGHPSGGGYAGTALNAVACTDATTGAIPHGGNVSPSTKHLISMGLMSAAATAVPGLVILLDRLLYYPGINPVVTTSQALVNSVTLPRYTTGAGVRAWLEVTTAFTTGTGVFTFGASGYTNQAGTTGRQHGVTVNTAASSALARIPHSGQAANNNWNPYLPLQAGDTGVRSVQSVQFTAAHAAGGAALVLGYELARLPLPAVNVYSERDFVFQLANLARIYDGACLQLMVYEPGALVASTPYVGSVDVAWS